MIDWKWLLDAERFIFQTRKSWKHSFAKSQQLEDNLIEYNTHTYKMQWGRQNLQDCLKLLKNFPPTAHYRSPAKARGKKSVEAAQAIKFKSLAPWRFSLGESHSFARSDSQRARELITGARLASSPSDPQKGERGTFIIDFYRSRSPLSVSVSPSLSRAYTA